MAESATRDSEGRTPALAAFRKWWADNGNKFAAVRNGVGPQQKAWCLFRDAWYAAEAVRSERPFTLPPEANELAAMARDARRYREVRRDPAMLLHLSNNDFDAAIDARLHERDRSPT